MVAVHGEAEDEQHDGEAHHGVVKDLELGRAQVVDNEDGVHNQDDVDGTVHDVGPGEEVADGAGRAGDEVRALVDDVLGEAARVAGDAAGGGGSALSDVGHCCFVVKKRRGVVRAAREGEKE